MNSDRFHAASSLVAARVLLIVPFRFFRLHLLLLLSGGLNLRGGVARDPRLIFFCKPRPGSRPFRAGRRVSVGP
jgi:hypothetical protein